MKHLSLLILIASLGCVLSACGGDDKKNDGDDHDSGQQQQDAGMDANNGGQDSGNMTTEDAGMDSGGGGGFHSGLDPNTQLSDLTEQQGQDLCNDAQAYANDQLTDNERDAANCIVNFVQNQDIPGSLDECQTELADCMQNMQPGVIFNELSLGCDNLDVTTACTGSTTVGDLEGCTNGFAGLWAFAKPITTCEGLLAANINDLQLQALGVIGDLQTGYGQCATVAAACPGGLTPPQF